MPRARLSKEGPIIAKAGFDVDTADLKDMLFSPSFVATRLALSGTVTTSSYSGSMSSFYRRAIFTYDTPFLFPPFLLFAGINDDGTAHFCPFVTYVNPAASPGTYSIFPSIEYRSFRDRFELYVCVKDSPTYVPTSWRYFVFYNGLEP